MTFDEAIDFMKNTAWVGSDERMEQMGEALEVLERYRSRNLIPVPPQVIHKYACPRCNMAFEKRDNYCSHCGQAIKWENSDEYIAKGD